MKHTYRTPVMIGTAIALVALAVYLLVFAQSAAAPPGVVDQANDTGQQSDGVSYSSDRATDTNLITIQNYLFSPTNIRIKKNTTVIWTNADPSPHRVSVVIDGKETVSNAINSNGSFSFVFDKAGTFSYYDSDIPDERGTIVVTDN